jgi:sialidase-1
MLTHTPSRLARFFAVASFSCLAPSLAWADHHKTAAGHPAEGELAPFKGEPKLEMNQVFKGERFPNVVVAVDGTIVATHGTRSVRARRSEDGGKTWGEEIMISNPGFQSGGLTVDETSGDIIAFVEERHPPAPIKVFRSKDHGKSWESQETRIGVDSNGNLPSLHMNDHGITLRHGKHKGRLIRPSRWYAGKNERARWPDHYTNAIFSDDGGKSWQASDPFPANGTGEAMVAELSDGTIYYNSRRHWAQEGANPRRRWTATSTDGGKTWKDLTFCEVLPDGPQDTNYGCMAGLTRLPVAGKDVLLYSNCDSPGGRKLGTVWASFDGGKTWPVKRLVFEGAFAYSSMTSGRPGTKSEGLAYLHFEGGPKGGSTMARFNLSWVVAGKATGDGEIPAWAR